MAAAARREPDDWGHDDERLHFNSQSLTGGVKTDWTDHVGLELSAGYLFDRFYYTGEDFSDRGHDRVSIDDGWFLSVQSVMKW